MVALSRGNPIKKEAAPALTRGLELLGLLARDGQNSLESLVRKTRWPKSSVWRYLQALESAGVVRQNPDNKHWEARQVLRPVDSATNLALENARLQLPQWASESGCCVELYRVDGLRLILMDRAEPEDELVALRARIGFERNLEELDSTALTFFAYHPKAQPDTKIWAWHEGRRLRIGTKIAQMRIEEARQLGWAQDNDFNENGFRRFSRAVLDVNQLVGVLAIVQRLTPRVERELPRIIKLLKSI